MLFNRIGTKCTSLFVGLALAFGLMGMQGVPAFASDGEDVTTLGEVAEDAQSQVPQPSHDAETTSTLATVAEKTEPIDEVLVQIVAPAPQAMPVAKATASAKSGEKALHLLKVTSVEWKDERGNAFDGKFELEKKYTVSVSLSTDEKNPFDAKKTKVAIAHNAATLSNVTPTSLVATYTFSALKDPKTATYTVNVTNDGNGEAAASNVKGKTAHRVVLRATPKEGYEFDRWEIVSGESASITSNILTIGTGNVTVKATFRPLLTNQADGDSATDIASGNTSGNDIASGNNETVKTVAGDVASDSASSYSVTATVANAQRGTVLASPTAGAAGTLVKLTATPSNEYYVFEKWEVKAGNVTISDATSPEATFEIGNANVQVEATFGIAENYAAVTYDANGGTGTMNELVVQTGETVNLKANTFTREGFTFNGWNTKADGSGTSVKDEGKVKVNSNVMLYAQWTSGTASFTISFSANGGSGTMNSITVADGDSVGLPANTLTRSGYTFNGWNTKADGSGTAYGDQATITPTGSMVLYATWRANAVTSSSSSRMTSSSSASGSTLSKTGDGTSAMPTVLVGSLSVLALAGAYALRRGQDD